jgi:DNA invertase Pin-like site-specific DNA recombinase
MFVGYGRISMQDQNPEMQVRALRDAGCEHVFIDTISRKMKMKERPQLNACMRFMKRGDVLHVWKLDRFCGSLHQLINNMVELEDRGIFLKSLTQPFDTTNIYGRMMMRMVAVFAEMERETILERTREGLLNARAKGVKLGRPPVAQEKIKEAMDLYKNGLLTVTDIEKKIGVHRASIYRHLRAHPELMRQHLEARL